MKPKKLIFKVQIIYNKKIINHNDYYQYQYQNMLDINDKNIIKLLIVGSAPETYKSFSVISSSELSLYPNIREYILRNALYIEYDSGKILAMKKFDIKDLPYHLRKQLRSTKPNKYDFDKFRGMIVEKIKELYPLVKEIEYSFISRGHSDPEIENTMDIVLQNDIDAYEKYGIKFTYGIFYEEDFKKQIKKISNNYDIVWFLCCSDPTHIIDDSDEYMENFKKRVKQNGYVIHTDPTNIGHDFEGIRCGFIDFDVRWHNMQWRKDEDHTKIKKFCDNLIKVDTGIYKFNNHD